MQSENTEDRLFGEKGILDLRWGDTIMNYAPVVVFAYNRYEEIVRAMYALSRNIGAQYTDVYIFSNAALSTNINDEYNVTRIRQTLQQFAGYFHSYQIICREVNEGANANMLNGIDYIIKKYGSVIVLEDDILTCPAFLSFMNQALQKYELNTEIFSICGYNPVVKELNMSCDSFSYSAFRSWGWAIWKDRWETFSWNEDLLDKIDLTYMHSQAPIYLTTLHEDIVFPTGENIYMDYKLACKQFSKRQRVIYSVRSLCDNIGLNIAGEHLNYFESYHNNNFDPDYSCTRFNLSDQELTPEIDTKYFFKFRWLGLELSKLKGWTLDREHVYFRMYYALANILLDGKNIEKWFQKRFIHSVAIYGWGDAGKTLFKLLARTSIEVRYIIDKRQIYADIPVYKEVSKTYNVDAIVVSALKDFCVIEESLYYQTKAKIISMEDVIFECFLWKENV